MDARLQQRVQRYGWDRAASTYEKSWQKQLEPAQARLMELASLSPGERVLDLACGTGLVTFRAADAVAALGVAVIVLWVSFRLGKSTVDVLLDAAPEGIARRITDEECDMGEVSGHGLAE